MKRYALALLMALAALAPAAANSLYGFGFAYGMDSISQKGTTFTLDWTEESLYSGIGFNGDVYIGQKLGFYAGGTFGLLTSVTLKQTLEGNSVTPPQVDLSDYTQKYFGNALLGLGAFLPLGSFDISGAVGFGLDFLQTKSSGDSSATGFASLGPGVSLSLGVPISSGVEAYASCRLIYGLALLSTMDGYVSDLSVTPAIGIRIKG